MNGTAFKLALKQSGFDTIYNLRNLRNLRMIRI